MLEHTLRERNAGFIMSPTTVLLVTFCLQMLYMTWPKISSNADLNHDSAACAVKGTQAVSHHELSFSLHGCFSSQSSLNAALQKN